MVVLGIHRVDAVRDPDRVAAVRRLALLDTPPEEAFDRLTRLASQIFAVPVALVTLVDEDRQYFKSCLGLPEPWASLRQTPLSHSFCQIVTSGDALVIEDAREHPLVRDNLAIRDLGVIAYAGVPLADSHGQVLGSFCVIDSRPRTWSEAEVGILRALAASVMTEIELWVAARQAERAHREKLALLESTHEGIFGLDVDARCTFVNRAAVEMLGYQPDELLGQCMHDLVHSRDVDGAPYPREACPLVRAIGLARGIGQQEEVLWRKDGTRFAIEYSSHPVVEDNVVRGAVVTFRDITARKQAETERARLLAAEQAARAEAEKLAAERAAILGQIAEGVIITDPTGRITFVNEAAHRLHGVAELGVPVDGYTDTYHLFTLDGRPYPSLELPLARAVTHGETVVDASWRIRRPDGTEVVARGSAAPVVAEDGSRLGAVLTIRDATAQSDLERQKDEFFANISHDLRTPVAAIKASVGVVLANEPTGTPEPLHRMLANIDAAADRMARLVADLLELTSLQAGRVQLRLERCDLRALAARSARAVEPLAETLGQSIQMDLPRKRCTLTADAERLERALVNLLTNAHQHGPPGGTIRLALEQQRHRVVLVVVDDGPGIHPDEHDRIFERFYQSGDGASRRSQGSGLGLAIARAMVELHGGRIWVDSTPGAGARFSISLPVAGHPVSARRSRAGPR